MAKSNQIDSVLAKETDGTIQITFRIPFISIKEGKEEALKELAKDIQIPGFRKGNAPINKAREHVSEARLIEKTLAKILPKALGEAIEKFKIKPLIYPKFELVSAKENEDWQVRAITCEFPKVDLGDYQKVLTNLIKTSSIWTPAKAKNETPKEKSKEEKEQAVIQLLLASAKVDIPKPLVDEEVDARLSGLLERTERLGLSLEKYLASVGKTPESLRAEYETQAKEALKLDLILSKIAEQKATKIADKEVDDAIRESAGDEKTFEKLNTPEQRRMVEAVLKKRSALDSLTSLV